ncbi:Mur ligase domain-containing protein [Streptomyces sp. GQFP]|uniref:Mur ligase domain-containing protein n=1 Tax=Streptomyces sp. GQFP TaxID=2907545 RepID=UPI001F15B79D|nr:Mur ligase domain-containing protein [Streptomyces sp. GQFP]UIX34291.1 Mur ligase domain-containing protein [Streptomyces sp. GQFP]
MSLTHIANVVGGRLADVFDPDALVTQPAGFDSRDAVPGSLFLALTGQHTDGHAYAEAAFKNRASASAQLVVCSSSWTHRNTAP